MTNPTPTSGAADLPEALHPIQRYEVVDCIDSKHVPAVIPNPHGPWVRYEDHAAALTAQAISAEPAGAWIERWYGSGGKDGYEGWSIVNKDDRALVAYLGRNVEAAVVTQIVMTHNATITTPTPQAADTGAAQGAGITAVGGDLITIRKPSTRVEVEWLAKLAHLLVRDVNDKLDELLAAAPQPAPPADSQQAPQGETNVQLDTDPNTAAPGQQRDMAGSVALGQPVGKGSDQVAGHPSAQGDKLLTVAERNIRSFLRSATFKSESDREAALNCVDVLWEAARAADSVQEDAERYRWLRRWKGQEHEPPFTVQHEIDGALWGGDLDAAIDADRKQGTNHD